MRPTRRDFLKLLAVGVGSLTIDPERILWVPGQKTIFLPSGKNLSYSSIIATEMDRIMPMVASIFERDDIFFAALSKKNDISG